MMELIEIDDENLEDFSEFIEEDMRENMDRTFFRGIGAMDGDTPVGALVYELKNSESEVDTTSRIRLMQGEDEVRKQMMANYTEAIEDEDVVESFYESTDESMSASLKDEGFSQEESESLDIVVNIEEVKKLSQMLKGKTPPDYIMSLSDVSMLQYRAFIKNCLFKGTRGLLDDLAYLPKSWFDMDVSSCAMVDDKVCGALLIKRAPSGKLYALLYTAFGPDFQKNLGLMMVRSAQKIVELYPEDTKVIIRRHNTGVKKLTDKLFANSMGDKVYSGKRSEG